MNTKEAFAVVAPRGGKSFKSIILTTLFANIGKPVDISKLETAAKTKTVPSVLQAIRHIMDDKKVPFHIRQKNGSVTLEKGSIVKRERRALSKKATAKARKAVKATPKKAVKTAAPKKAAASKKKAAVKKSKPVAKKAK